MNWASLGRKGKQALVEAWRSAQIEALPLRKQMQGYGAASVKRDGFAGLSVALLAFPQGLAFAAIAGVPIVYGALGAAIAAILGGFFSSSRVTILGPSNATAFLLFSFFVAKPELANYQLLVLPWLALLIGLILLFGALLRLSDYTQYISRSVIVGYLTGAALLIIANQAKHLLGIDLVAQGVEAPRSFVAVVHRLLVSIPQTQWLPLLLGVLTIAVYLLGKRFLKGWPVFALVLVLMSAVALGAVRLWPEQGAALAMFQGFEASSLLPELPRTGELSFSEFIQPLFGVAFALAFLASLENSIMSRSLGDRIGQQVNSHQDTLSLGLANIGGAFFGGMPASGSLTRSVLNYESGGRTGVAAIFAGVFCLVMAWALAGLIEFVPKAVLAALVIGVSISLIQMPLLRVCARATHSDAVVLFVSFLSTLIMPLHVAIFVGAGTAVMLYLRKAAKPEMVEYGFDEEGTLLALEEGGKRAQPAVSIVHVEGDLFFGAADVFRSQVQEIWKDKNLSVIVLRLRNARNLDATSMLALAELGDFARDQGRHLLLSGVRPSLFKLLSRSGMVQRLGRENFFLNHPQNPNVATAQALKRAKEILGTQDAEVKIFVNQSGDKQEGG